MKNITHSAFKHYNQISYNVVYRKHKEIPVRLLWKGGGVFNNYKIINIKFFLGNVIYR
jgi:hypothetical protein